VSGWHAIPSEPELRLWLRSNPLYLSGARELVCALAKRLGFDDLSCCQIALAVDEALANIIRHGYGRRPDGPIWVSLYPTPAQPDTKPDAKGGPVRAELAIVIEDEAQQVDPTQIKGRELDEIRPGGLGVHIMREVMDEVLFERRESVGMRLTMRKTAPRPEDIQRRPCAEAGRADDGCGRLDDQTPSGPSGPNAGAS